MISNMLPSTKACIALLLALLINSIGYAKELPYGAGITTQSLAASITAEANAKQLEDSNLLNLDLMMQKNYNLLREQVAHNMSPVIVVQFNTSGGRFSLFRRTGENKRSKESVEPVSIKYELLKSVSHVPLLIYSTIARYAKAPTQGQWIQPLQEVKQALQLALDNLNKTTLQGKNREHCRTILVQSINYINQITEKRNYTFQGFKKYANEIFPAIGQNLLAAATIQVNDTAALIVKWKKELPKNEWQRLYVIINAPHTLSEKNAVYQVFKKLMYQKDIGGHLILRSGNKNDISGSLQLAAHLTMDRLAARLILSKDKKLLKALSSKKDLVSTAADAAIQHMHMHEINKPPAN